MMLVCEVDVAPVLAELHRLVWEPGGSGPGHWAMISTWPQPVPVEPIIEQVLAHFPGRRRGMTLLSRLIPGQLITPHRDRHDRDCTVRIHVPLMTNRAAVFCTGDIAYNMAPGYAWLIDPTQEHSVYNGGTTDRIHLIFNALSEATQGGA